MRYIFESSAVSKITWLIKENFDILVNVGNRLPSKIFTETQINHNK